MPKVRFWGLSRVTEALALLSQFAPHFLILAITELSAPASVSVTLTLKGTQAPGRRHLCSLGLGDVALSVGYKKGAKISSMDIRKNFQLYLHTGDDI